MFQNIIAVSSIEFSVHPDYIYEYIRTKGINCYKYEFAHAPQTRDLQHTYIKLALIACSI